MALISHHPQIRALLKFDFQAMQISPQPNQTSAGRMLSTLVVEGVWQIVRRYCRWFGGMTDFLTVSRMDYTGRYFPCYHESVQRNKGMEGM